MDSQLTIKDLEILIESLDAWENKEIAGEMMGELMSMMILGKDVTQEDKAQYEIDRDVKREKAEFEKRERKETSLLLKAKLVMLKQEIPIKDANKILEKEQQ